ncbi:MAG: murein L,D-transpeptidase catalytic domain family protein [Elusimicrobiales bacterium]
MLYCVWLLASLAANTPARAQELPALRSLMTQGFSAAPPPVKADIPTPEMGIAEDEPPLPDDPDREHFRGGGQERAGRNIRFETPNYGPGEREQILAKYRNIDRGRLISRRLLEPALLFYHANLNRLSNPDYLTVVDFSKHSSEARLYMVDMDLGSVKALHVAHGSGSDPGNTGYAKYFSNTPDSNMSSLGFYLTAETYSGKHGYSLRLDGLSATNSNVRGRAVVVHGASYVQERSVRPGRSWGCFAVSESVSDFVVKKLAWGSLIYAGLGK